MDHRHQAGMLAMAVLLLSGRWWLRDRYPLYISHLRPTYLAHRTDRDCVLMAPSYCRWLRSRPSIVGCTSAAGCSLALGYRVATAEEAVPSPMKAATTFPELSQDITSLSMFAPELVAYLENPTTTCTLFAPNNQVCCAAGLAADSWLAVDLRRSRTSSKRVRVAANHTVCSDGINLLCARLPDCELLPVQLLGLELGLSCSVQLVNIGGCLCDWYALYIFQRLFHQAASPFMHMPLSGR